MAVARTEVEYAVYTAVVEEQRRAGIEVEDENEKQVGIWFSILDKYLFKLYELATRLSKSAPLTIKTEKMHMIRPK